MPVCLLENGQKSNPLTEVLMYRLWLTFYFSSFLSFCFFFSLWVRGRDNLAHITVCTSALSLIWHQVRPPVCEGGQPLASWALILIQTGMAFSHWWPVLRPLMLSSHSLFSSLFYFFSLNTHYISSIYLTLCPRCHSLYITFLFHHMNSSLPHLSSCSHEVFS